MGGAHILNNECFEKQTKRFQRGGRSVQGFRTATETWRLMNDVKKCEKKVDKREISWVCSSAEARA